MTGPGSDAQAVTHTGSDRRHGPQRPIGAAPSHRVAGSAAFHPGPPQTIMRGGPGPISAGPPPQPRTTRTATSRAGVDHARHHCYRATRPTGTGLHHANHHPRAQFGLSGTGSGQQPVFQNAGHHGRA